MNFIQVILLLGSAAALLFYILYLRSALRDRMLAVLLFFTSIVMILAPDLTVLVANFLGVGRGTDLVLYLALVTGMFVALGLYAKTARLEGQITELVRSLAILNVKKPKQNE